MAGIHEETVRQTRTEGPSIGCTLQNVYVKKHKAEQLFQAEGNKEMVQLNAIQMQLDWGGKKLQRTLIHRKLENF